ncbi:unnamed protein product [Periconia digitata]|uniref:Uncharacterized protein n=1 Tax=Periconia digitata TaxID=1303443 RepID=A0A9W4U4M9_9PLEO|nr:unnamed protein product [Periconia digitata]
MTNDAVKNPLPRLHTPDSSDTTIDHHMYGGDGSSGNIDRKDQGFGNNASTSNSSPFRVLRIHSDSSSAASVAPPSVGCADTTMGSPLPVLQNNTTPRHRDPTARSAPSPLGPGYDVGDYGSDMSGLVATSTGNVDSPESDVGENKSNSGPDEGSMFNLEVLAPPCTPTHASNVQIADDSDPPVLNGRTTGICNLPFIAASPSEVLPLHGYSENFSYTSIKSIGEALGDRGNRRASQLQLRLTETESSKTNAGNGSAMPSSPPLSLSAGGADTFSNSMRQTLASGIPQEPQCTFTNENDPFVDNSDTINSSSSLPNLDNNRDLMRKSWIRNKSSRIGSLSRTMGHLQRNLGKNLNECTDAEIGAYTKTRSELSEALNLDKQVESRRRLFMPKDKKPLRTPVEGDGFKGLSPTMHSDHLDDEEMEDSRFVKDESSPLLGYEMGLMERRGHAAITKDKADKGAKWGRIIDGMDDGGKKSLRKSIVGEIRGAAKRRRDDSGDMPKAKKWAGQRE